MSDKPQAKPKGRPPIIFDDRLKAQLCALISTGCSRYRAAAAIGCAPKTVRDALRRDPEFAAAMSRAEVKQEIVLLKRIDDASKAPLHWRAASWLLERNHPDRYGKRAPGTMTPAQVAAVLSQFADILTRGIRDAQDRRKVGNDLKLLTHSLSEQVSGGSSQ